MGLLLRGCDRRELWTMTLEIGLSGDSRDSDGSKFNNTKEPTFPPSGICWAKGCTEALAWWGPRSGEDKVRSPAERKAPTGGRRPVSLVREGCTCTGKGCPAGQGVRSGFREWELLPLPGLRLRGGPRPRPWLLKTTFQAEPVLPGEAGRGAVRETGARARDTEPAAMAPHRPREAPHQPTGKPLSVGKEPRVRTRLRPPPCCLHR